MTKVYVTGLGAVSAQGPDWTSVTALTPDQQPRFSEWPADMMRPAPGSLIGRVTSYAKARFGSASDLRVADKYTTMTLAASGACLENAGLLTDGKLNVSGDDVATRVGTSRPEYGGFQRFAPPVLSGQPGKLNPALFPYLARSVACGQMCITFGLRGYSTNLAAGPLSGLHAIGRGFDLVRTGRAPYALVGGAECLSRTSLAQSLKLFDGYLDPENPEFFGSAPALVVPGEGVVMLLLESEESIQARGIKPLAVLEGYRIGRLGKGDAQERYHTLLSDFLAANDIGWPAVDCVSSSASGGNLPHDAIELAALMKLSGNSGHQPVITACRSFTGEAEAASSAMQAAVAVSAVAGGSVVPTLNAAANAVFAQPSEKPPATALVSALDDAGHYSFMAFKQA
jgi:3-oxoacyl-[acyl-carrier-protein] synthase II